MDKGDYEGAITDFTKAIEKNPDYAYAYNNRGSAKYKAEQYSSAIEDFDKAIKLNGNYITAYLNRGNAKEMTRDIDGACADWKKAKDGGIKNAEFYIKQMCKQ